MYALHARTSDIDKRHSVGPICGNYVSSLTYDGEGWFLIRSSRMIKLESVEDMNSYNELGRYFSKAQQQHIYGQAFTTYVQSTATEQFDDRLWRPSTANAPE